MKREWRKEGGKGEKREDRSRVLGEGRVEKRRKMVKSEEGKTRGRERGNGEE